MIKSYMVDAFNDMHKKVKEAFEYSNTPCGLSMMTGDDGDIMISFLGIEVYDSDDDYTNTYESVVDMIESNIQEVLSTLSDMHQMWENHV